MNGDAYANAKLVMAKIRADQIYDSTPLSFGWFANIPLLTNCIKTMLMRAYMYGVQQAMEDYKDSV